MSPRHAAEPPDEWNEEVDGDGEYPDVEMDVTTETEEVGSVFYCESCKHFDDAPVTRYVRLQDDNIHDRPLVHETALEFYCGLCGEIMEEALPCIDCRNALPEDGADHCSACLDKLNATPVMNDSGRFLRLMADMESDEAKVPTVYPADPGNAVRALQWGPMSRVRDIAKNCEKFSDATHEVVAHVYSVKGMPVVSFRREPRIEGLDALLRAGSNAPLMFKRQA